MKVTIKETGEKKVMVQKQDLILTRLNQIFKTLK